MSVHINELIETAKRDGGAVYHVSPNVRETVGTDWAKFEEVVDIHKALDQAVCFYAGEWPVGEKIGADLNLINLPYPYTWLEFSCSLTGVLIGVLAWAIDDETWLAAWERDPEKDWIFCGAGAMRQGEKDVISMTSGSNKSDEKILISYLFAALKFVNFGGTHASPRLHLRRGHPRQYAPGKYCWVQPCVVGNKAAGMVHKDYAIKHAA